VQPLRRTQPPVIYGAVTYTARNPG